MSRTESNQSGIAGNDFERSSGADRAVSTTARTFLPASLGSAAIGLSLLAISGLAFYLRALGFEWVFVGYEVVFPPADAQYHLRRAFFSFVNFPTVLLFDHYINFPDGAAVPWPPLFDFVVGGGAR